MFTRLPISTYQAFSRAATRLSPYHVARHVSSLSTPLVSSQGCSRAQVKLPAQFSFVKFSTETSEEAIMKLVPKDLAPLLAYSLPDCYTTLPEQAWNMGSHLYKKGHVLTVCLELLSDSAQAQTPETQARIATLLAPFSTDMPDSSLVTLQKEHTRLGPLLETMDSLLRARREIIDLHAMIREAQEEIDSATKALPHRGLVQQEVDSDENIQSWLLVKEQTKEELTAVEQRVEELEAEVLDNVLPKDVDDHRNAILEVRPGTGGDEAMLFARDIFHMYENVAGEMGWRFEVNEISTTETGGYREASATITGDSVFGSLKFETGVHRVQRVPATETQGRIHTSTMTVAVLPEVKDVDVVIRECDLRIDVYRASGAGGQHVNTTESAVRITHIPTGTVVTNQDQRSQHKNKEKAMTILRARIYENQRQKLAEERARLRGEQIGSGDRSERIRTYNFAQSRVTDHRVNVTLHSVESFLSGETFPELLDKLKQKERLDILASALKVDPAVVADKKKGKK